MITALAIAVAGLSVVVLLTFGATVELHRQVMQLRQHSGLVDESRVISYSSDVLRSSLPGYVLPAEEDGPTRSAILILSDGCSSCLDLAAALSTRMIDSLFISFVSRSEDAGEELLAKYGLSHFKNIQLDGGELAAQLEVSVTPAIVRFEGLYSVSAITVPSVRQLEVNLDWLSRGQSKIGRPEFQMAPESDPSLPSKESQWSPTN